MKYPQKPFDIAMVISTTLQPTIKKTINSIFEQNYKGRIQVLVGIDKPLGNKDIIHELQNECPENISITVIDLGYSTSVRHGGLYNNRCGGALRTILTYAANSRYVTYFDDDNWFAPHHVSDLLNAIHGYDWAFTYRWFVDEKTSQIICEDKYFSAGPGKGFYKNSMDGFVDTNCLVIDKIRCHMILPLWCFGTMPDGSGDDRRIFKILNNNFKYNSTKRPSVYYVLDTARYPEGTEWLRKKGYNIT